MSEKRGAGRPKMGRWAEHWTECKCCGRSDSPHRGNGLCGACKSMDRRGDMTKDGRFKKPRWMAVVGEILNGDYERFVPGEVWREVLNRREANGL